MYVCMYVCVCVYVNMYVCVYVCMYVYIYVYMCTYVYILFNDAVNKCVTGEWRRLHNDKLYDLYCSQIITRVMIFVSMRWLGHIACSERRQVHAGFWWGDLRKGDHLE